jgi:hypothetical protein
MGKQNQLQSFILRVLLVDFWYHVSLPKIHVTRDANCDHVMQHWLRDHASCKWKLCKDVYVQPTFPWGHAVALLLDTLTF